VFLNDGFYATGEVSLANARIDEDLDASGGAFNNGHCQTQYCLALLANGLRVSGDMSLDGFRAKGQVSLRSVRIGKNMSFYNASFDDAFLTFSTIDGLLALNGLSRRPQTIFLEYAKVGEFLDDPYSWPRHGGLFLNGFVYHTFAGNARLDWKSRIEWLGLQGGQFRPQPYEELVQVLRGMGYDRDARQIAIEEQRALRISGQLGPLRWLGNWLLYLTIGYGYRTWLAAVWVLALLLAGTSLFASAKREGIVVPSDKEAYSCWRSHASLPQHYPPFNPMYYSLDVVLPFLDLRQKSSWQLKGRKTGDWLHAFYEVFLISYVLAVYLLTGLVLAALTGLVK
jgi:hypothetical protein